MTTKLLIDRELLERLAAPLPGDNGWQTWHTQEMIEASKELRAALAAPVQGEAVCGICDGKGFIDFSDEKRRARYGGKWGRCLNCQPYDAPPQPAEVGELVEALRGMLALDEENHQRYMGDEDVCLEVRKARAALAKLGGKA